MAILERHKSPDQLLELLVDFTDGDWSIGFAGNAWHTHGDILSAWGYEGSPEQATRQFVDDIIASRRPIVIWRVNEKIKRFDIPTQLDRAALNESLAKYGVPGETLEVRYWNGQLAAE